MSRKPYYILWIVAIALIALLYFAVDPAMAAWMPKCPMKVLTGFDCPGCGSQRMLHALLHADFVGAWHANPFLLLMIPYIALVIVASALPHRFPRLSRFVNSPAAILTFLLLAIAWTILRNI